MSSMTALEAPVSAGFVPEPEGSLNPVAFSRLLDWLDDGVNSDGQSYVEMRRRLVSYFDRRDRHAADELADETLNRIGKTLERDTVINVRPPARYCYVVARFVFLEDMRRERATGERRPPRKQIDAVADPASSKAFDDEPDIRQQRLDALRQCLDRLTPQKRSLVIEYYRGTGGGQILRRRRMADRLGISMNALAIRAHRVRAALEACMEPCCGEP